MMVTQINEQLKSTRGTTISMYVHSNSCQR
jgi:hypothetical protein